MRIKVVIFAVACSYAFHSRAMDSTIEKKYVINDVYTMLADDVCYLDAHIAEKGDSMTHVIWDFFVAHATFGVKQDDSLVFVDLFGLPVLYEPFVLCIPYYDTLQMDYFALGMLYLGEGGKYVPISSEAGGNIDFILLNYLFADMSSYALRMNTLFHEAVHFWIQYNVALPKNEKKRRVLHEVLAYTLSWEVALTLFHPSMDSIFTQLVVELDRANVPDGYYTARLPGVDAECLAHEIQIGTDVFTSLYVQSIALLLLENEGRINNKWYRKKYKILKQGNLI